MSKHPASYNGTLVKSTILKGQFTLTTAPTNIIMGETIVASGTADGFYVNTNFTVPQLPGGDYNFLIEDIKEGNLNSTGYNS